MNNEVSSDLDDEMESTFQKMHEHLNLNDTTQVVAAIRITKEILNIVGYDKHSETRARILVSIICVTTKTRKETYDKIMNHLRSIEEWKAEELLSRKWNTIVRFTAQKHWQQLRHIFLRMRPVAILILEEWQKRVCAPNMSGRKRDLEEFQRFIE